MKKAVLSGARVVIGPAALLAAVLSGDDGGFTASILLVVLIYLDGLAGSRAALIAEVCRGQQAFSRVRAQRMP